MITIARYKLEEILPHIGLGKPKLTLETSQGTYKVKATGTRLECLRRSQKCVRCRRSGSIWQLEASVQNPPKVATNCFVDECHWCALHRAYPPVGKVTPHLNLYHVARDGRLILMTQDHIKPRHAGGEDKIENLQTMCRECNSYKGGMLPHEYEKVMLPHERLRDSRPVDERSSTGRGSNEVRQDAADSSNSDQRAA